VKQLPLFNIEPLANLKGHRPSEPSTYIPEDVIVAAIELMGAVDLDPYCPDTSVPAIPAKIHFTIDDSGLQKSWGPKRRIFLHPPASRATGAWINKLCDEYEAGNITQAVAYVKAAVDSDWWHRLIVYPVCFVDRRLTVQKRGTAPAIAVVYLGTNLDGFADAFSQIGPIYVPFQQGLFRRVSPKLTPAQIRQSQREQNRAAKRQAEAESVLPPQAKIEPRQTPNEQRVVQYGHYTLTVLFGASYLTIKSSAWDSDSGDQHRLLDAILGLQGILPSRHGHVSKTQEGEEKLVFSFQKNEAKSVVSQVEALLSAPLEKPTKKKAARVVHRVAAKPGKKVPARKGGRK
jgi:hypothetical protein